MVKGSIDFNFTLSARKEVVVSAGALQSPQILMVSGIGPADVLQNHNIEVIADRPGVGQNLQDQPWFFSTHRVNVLTGSELSNNETYAANAVEQYQREQNGPLSNIGGDVLAWEKLPKKNRKALNATTLDFLDAYPSDWPDMEYIGLALPTAPVPDDQAQYMSFTFGLIAFESRGNVSIASNDTATLPKVTFNYLKTKTDQELAVQGFHRLREWIAATDISLEEITPGKNVTTDESILAYLRQTGSVLYHASCTCKLAFYLENCDCGYLHD